ncbi:MAG: glycosyltransferase, partial [Patescibacteria group bacterium]
HAHLQIPNKLWSILAAFSRVSLCSVTMRRTGRIDAVFLPNLGFFGDLPTDIPTVLLLHDLSFLIEPRWFSWKQRLWHFAIGARHLIRSAARLLAVSETTMRDATRLLGIPAERIRVIPIGSTLSAPTCSENGRGTSARSLLAFGANDPRKNIATAIESVRRLRMHNEFRDVTLTIVGAVHELSLPEWIRIVVRPSDRELVEIYANASVLLYPSWYEGYGLPLHEAASFGIPCIASTAGALPETAPIGTIFAHPAKPHEWVEALRIVLMQPPHTPVPPSDSAWTEAARILREQCRE